MYKLESMPFGIDIDLSRDSLFDEAGMFKFKENYLNKNLGETSPQHRYAYVASIFGSNQEHADRLYKYLSLHWLSAATPVLQYDATDTSGLPASCYLPFTDDTKEGLVYSLLEIMYMSMGGGGVGHYPDTRMAGDKSTGKMPHLEVKNPLIDAFKQKTRRGAYAAYMDIDDPEIEQFIELRNPSRKSGSSSVRAFNLHHAVNITDAFMSAVLEGSDVPLKCKKTNVITKYVNARDLLIRVVEARALHGEPYIHFIDNSNKKLPKFQSDKGLRIEQSNLCCVAPDTLADTDQGCLRVSELVGRHDVKYYDPRSEQYITPLVPMSLISTDATVFNIVTRSKEGVVKSLGVTHQHKHSAALKDRVTGQLKPCPKLKTTEDLITLYREFNESYELYVEWATTDCDEILYRPDGQILAAYRRVHAINKRPNKESVYCLNMGTPSSLWLANDFVTGNSEIILPTDKDRTAVCFLSSLNLNYYDDWKDDPYFVSDTVEMLDNAITTFIDTLEYERDMFFSTRDIKYLRGFAMQKCLTSVKAERAMGIGTLGYHQYLQKKMLPFDSSFQTVGLTRHVFSNIKEKADKATLELGKKRGACPDSEGSETPVRNARTLSIAPNACVLSDAIIQTASGLKSYSEVFQDYGVDESTIVENNQVGWHEFDRTLSVKGANNSTSKSNRVYYSGKQRVYQLQLEDGSTIECTKNHKLLTFTTLVQWTQALTINKHHTLVTKDNLYECLNSINGVMGLMASLKLLHDHNISIDTSKLDKFNGVSFDVGHLISQCEEYGLDPVKVAARLCSVKNEYSDKVKNYPSNEFMQFIKDRPSVASNKEYYEVLYQEDVYEEVKPKFNMYSIDFQMSRYGLSLESAQEKIQGIKNKTAGTLESFIYRHGEEKGEELYRAFCDNSAHTKDNYKKWYGDDWENKWEYMQIRRRVSSTLDGYRERFPTATEEEYREYTSSFGTSLKSYLKKDPVNGLSTFIKNRRKANQSKQAMEILNEVRNIIPQDIELVYHGCPEEWFVVDLQAQETASYDLYVPSLNLIIDLHGEPYHAYPKFNGDVNELYLKYTDWPSYTWNQLKERDDSILRIAEDNGYNYEVVWINSQNSFKNEKQKVVNDILNIIEDYSNENIIKKTA